MGIIRSHQISAGRTPVARVTADFLQVLDVRPGADLVTRGGTQIFLRETDLPTIVRTINLISFSFMPDGSAPDVFTPTVFGAPTGAGTGTGMLFVGATALQTTGTVGTASRGYLISYADTAARDLALRNSNVAPFRSDSRYEISPEVTEIIGTETTLDADEGGFVQQVLVGGTGGVIASNAQERRLFYIIGRDPAAPNTAVASEVRQLVRAGAAVPGDAIIENGNSEILHVVINS